MIRSGYSSLVACLFLAACGGSGNGTGSNASNEEILPATESFKVFGDYVVHFNAIPTTDLSNRITQENNIVRSPNRIMLLVNVRRGTADGLDEAVPASVRASAANMSGQLRNLDMREIREETTLYYVSETQVQNGETLVFTIEATPEGTTEDLMMKFRKTFYIGD